MTLEPQQNKLARNGEPIERPALPGDSRRGPDLKIIDSSHPKKKRDKARIAGEPWVWLSGLGLSIGLLMVTGLLSLILVRGTEVFWPKRVVEIKLTAGPAGEPAEVITGEIVLRRKKHVSEPSSKSPPEELQIFTGNKEIYGQAFRFVDAERIASIAEPAKLMRMERMEYGDAFGAPLTLRLENGQVLPATDPQFFPTLRREVAASVGRWKKIQDIEKRQIGAVNRELDALGFTQKSLEKNPEPANASRLSDLENRKQALQKEYETLAGEARELRQAQERAALTYRLPDGAEHSLPLGQILHVDYPNELSVSQRVAAFLGNLWNFVSEDPREANTEGGVFPAIFGTLVMTVLMSLAVVPFGVLAAIYLREYARQGWFVRAVRIAVNNLAGVPSIVFGVFGLGFFVYVLGGSLDRLFFSERLPIPTFGTGGILWASLTLALMTVPVVIVSTEEALAAVPRGMREGAIACGASKWQTIRSVLLPAAAPGILTGMILAMARGAGEVAPLMLVGVVKLAPTLPINGIFPYIHLDQKFMHLGFNIYDLGFQSPDSEAAQPMVFATTLLLILLVVLLNLGAIFLRERLRKKYATGAF